MARGERLTELLKQPQYQPLPVEEQVAVIYAGVNGYTDELAVKQVVDFEKAFLGLLREKGKDVLELIRTRKLLDDEIEKKLKFLLDDCLNSFS